MRVFIICSICTFLLMSCSSDLQNYPVGSDFIENDINIRKVDTFSIKAGTFKLDSLNTSGTGRILLGSIFDDNFGQLIAQSYFQVQNSDFSISNKAVYDSIGIVLNYDTYFYGDTTAVQTYTVHRIIETFEPETGDDFYNNSKLSYDPEPLGQLSFKPKPNKDSDSLYIPLSDELGEEIFNKIKDDEINNSDDFLQYFRGLTIIPDSLTNSHVLGFKFDTSSSFEDSSNMRLFYTEDKDDVSEGNDQVISFFITSEDKQFNRITNNFEDFPIDGFEDSATIISSEDTGDFIFSQAGTGISARIEIPTLKKLKETSEHNTALGATLRFSPQIGSYNSLKPLKDSLSVFVIDKKNRIVNQLVDAEEGYVFAVLNEDGDEFNENTYYEIDMSGFVETILNSSYDLDYVLMIQFIDYNKTVNSTVIQNFNSNDSNIKLDVTFLDY